MNKPKISIITITFNSERTLEETIKSVEAQNYDNLEYIIVDGGSTDATLEIVERHKSIVSKLVSEPDEGISDAFNKGIKMSEGDVIGIINSDDMLYEGALEKIAEVYDPEIDVYFGHTIVCNEDGSPKHILHSQENLSFLKYSCCINHPSTFVSKKTYEEYGVFDKGIFYAMDYDLLLRFYNAGANFKYVDEILSFYRIGGINMKMRKKTIKEVRNISVNHGGSVLIANSVLIYSRLKELLRPIQRMLKIHSRRVEKLK